MSSLRASGNLPGLTSVCPLLSRRKALHPTEFQRVCRGSSRNVSLLHKNTGTCRRLSFTGACTPTPVNSKASNGRAIGRRLSSKTLTRGSKTAEADGQADSESLSGSSHSRQLNSGTVSAVSEGPTNQETHHVQSQMRWGIPLRERVKGLMRHVPHPVAVITSTDTSVNANGDPSAWRGATVSSFNTVTLDPTPIVSFNIKQLSSTYEAIRASGLFNVHLFLCDHMGQKIAEKFARGNASSPFHRRDGTLASFARWRSDTAPALRPNSPPIIQYFPKFQIKCRFLSEKAVEIGDHMVVFGEVEHVYDRLEGVDGSDICLYYVNGRYAQGPLGSTHGW
ncbi:Flavin reductase like domain-containing protein [Cladophialophora immunda]|nr:Flavin reductase like domain-containing protein [Cladophialophora immunda]